MLTATVVLLQQAPAHADDDGTGPYRLVGSQSNKCMDDPRNSTDNNTAIDIYTCLRPTPANELWRFEPTPDGSHLIYNIKSGLCLTVQNARTTNNTPIIQYTCTYGANEEWSIQEDPRGVRFVSKNGTNKCITVRNGGTANGSKLIQYDCNGGRNQAWSVEYGALSAADSELSDSMA